MFMTVCLGPSSICFLILKFQEKNKRSSGHEEAWEGGCEVDNTDCHGVSELESFLLHNLSIESVSVKTSLNFVDTFFHLRLLHGAS